MNDNIGKKIRYFRQRARLSQLDLELAIHAAQGSISRIESGRVNPTKETIWVISEVLKLSREEVASLFGLDRPFPNKEDQMRARNGLKDYFDNESTVALLLDPHWNVIYASKGLLKMLGVPRKIAEVAYGISLLSILFLPPLNVSKKLTNKSDVLLYELAWFRKMIGDRLKEEWCTELLASLSKSREFKRYWALSQDLDMHIFPKEARRIEFCIKKKSYTFATNFTQLNSDPRFEILDYLKIG